jgi:NAD(P)-dependent dehydrogenase (short-subunit alcohol dehydrogenase family)
MRKQSKPKKQKNNSMKDVQNSGFIGDDGVIVNAGTEPTLENPVDKYPKPEYPEQEQRLPGSEQEMDPKPDHGENTYKGSGKLIGRKAVITGADSGIGKAVAIAFAREGADVVISYLNEHEDANETASYVLREGRKAILVPGDISSEEHCKQIVDKALQELGGIDILVNNAAMQITHETLQDISAEEWDRTFKTNVNAMFYLCKAAEPHLKPGSAIVNTTSVNAYTPKPVLIPYTITKAAIQNFTATLAQLWAEKGIRVNCVAPGPIWTPLIPASFTPEETAKFGSTSPMKRAGQPAELAPVYVLLASQEASYVSGATVPVTGGMPTI